MTAALVATAQALIGAGKGLLAMDESNPTCNKRFATAGIPQTVEARLLHGAMRGGDRRGAGGGFDELRTQSVVLEAMILKPNMVLPGLTSTQQDPAEVVASATVRCLRRTVPAAVAGVAFLSGGQLAELASARLNAR